MSTTLSKLLKLAIKFPLYTISFVLVFVGIASLNSFIFGLSWIILGLIINPYTNSKAKHFFHSKGLKYKTIHVIGLLLVFFTIAVIAAPRTEKTTESTPSQPAKTESTKESPKIDEKAQKNQEIAKENEKQQLKEVESQKQEVTNLISQIDSPSDSDLTIDELQIQEVEE
jgi:hypothetical protein